MLPESQRELIRRRCESVLRQNWREGIRPVDRLAFAYTCPSPRRYPWQWYWDSCCHAIAWRRFDRDRSKRELVSLLGAQRPDGFIGHTIFWEGPLRGSRRYTYNVLTSSDPMTASIQPPMLAWAWRIAVGDPAAEPRIARQHDWLQEHRTLDDDGLLWIVAPDESGQDASNQFDAIWGHQAHGLPGYLGLVHRNRRLGFDLHRIAAAGGPVCCEVVTNVLYNLARLALGRPSLTPALIERTYDARRGLFVPRARPAPRRTPAVTIAALAPLALPDLPEEIGRRLVEEHLLNPDRFWTGGAAAIGLGGRAELHRQRPRPAASASLLARADVDEHGMAVLAGPGAPGLRRAGGPARAAARVRGGGGGAARVLRPLHRGGHGGAGLRVVEPGAGAARARPRGRPHQLPRRDARGLASSPWTHSET